MSDHRSRADVETGDDVVRAALDSLTTHMFLILDHSGIITSWNAGAERLLGHTTQQAIGHHVSMLFHTDGGTVGFPVQDLIGAERSDPVSTDLWLAHADGSGRFANVTVSAFAADSRSGFALLARAAAPPSEASDGSRGDLLATRLEDTLRQLAESHALLSSEIADRTQGEAARIRLLRRLVMAQEKERRRIARDLHDDLGQRLTTLRLTLEALGIAEKDAANASELTANALTTLAEIDRGIDFLAWELRPAALDELGLTRVLDNYVHEWAQHAGVRAAFHSSSPEMPRFSPEVEATVYRITQEALNNVAKHARAGSVNVLLEQRGDELVLAVEDDGVGCDSTSSSETMVGLIGMRERAEAVGGSIEFEPTPGGGATVLARIPMSTPSPVGRFHDRPVDPSLAVPPALTGSAEPNDVQGPGLSVLRARLQELQQAVSARDEFIATVAHELRNPVAPLMFQVRLAIERSEKLVAAGESLSADWVQSQLRRIEQRLHRLLETLERLLDVSRLATGRIDLQPEPVDLARAVREVTSTFEAEMAVARCQLVFSQRGEATGWWDRMRLEQICRNLVSNAIRFGAGRPIEVVVDGDRDFAMLQVRDHGVGIAPHHHARIFERFERGLEQRSGGFGIGLWVVKSICVAMGGSTSVESQLGEGACFTVMLPPAQRARGEQSPGGGQIVGEETIPSERRPTGVPGLDRVLEGGLLVSRVYIVQGPPGAGKTILANQMCFHHASTGEHAVYVTLLAESHSRMFANLRRMSFFDEAAIPERVYYIGGYSTLQSGGLGALVAMIRGAIQKQKATLLVVDGLVSAQESAPTEREFKTFIHELQTLTELVGCTVILLTNVERASGFFPEHTMVDGVLHLTDELSELRPLRHIRILKLRGSAPIRGLHSVQITDRGLEVRPRIETRFPPGEIREEHVAAGAKLAFGLDELDQMLRGGVRTGSITMLLGSSGSGKTLLGMQFLSTGLKRGERAVYFGFYERPEAILTKCQRIGIGGLKEGVDKGTAEIVWHRPIEGVVDELGESLIDTVRRIGAQRVVIDGVEGFERAADFPERMSHVYSAVAQELERLGATTIFTMETRQLFGKTIEVPLIGSSAATQNIILLRHVEHRASLLRVMAILKVRDDAYDGRMRELQITDDGIKLLDTFAAESQVASGGGFSTDLRTRGTE